MPGKQKIVVLGAGFGGMRAAILLSKDIQKYGLLNKYEVVLVDRNDYQTYTPTLYEVATTAKEMANYLDLKEIVTIPVQKIIGDYPVTFLKRSVEGLDLLNGLIHFSDGPAVNFDYLLLALGAETNYFGIPGLKENSLPLKTFLDAILMRDRIMELFSSQESARIVIGGGGPTGVELAGELQGWLCRLEAKNKKCSSQITIVDASPDILWGLHPKVVKPVKKRLRALGVETIVNDPIAVADKNNVLLKSGLRVPFDLLIWTGGVKASSLIGNMPMKLTKRGQAEVAGRMECLPQTPDLKLYGKIYGIGDAVCFYDPLTGKPVPGLARTALTQARIAAHNIMESIRLKEGLTNKPRYAYYQPLDFSYVIPVGGKWAAAKVGSLVITGFLGWLLKILVELNYLMELLPFWMALKNWFKSVRVIVKNDRTLL